MDFYDAFVVPIGAFSKLLCSRFPEGDLAGLNGFPFFFMLSPRAADGDRELVLMGFHWRALTSEFTGLRGFPRRSGGMMGWAYYPPLAEPLSENPALTQVAIAIIKPPIATSIAGRTKAKNASAPSERRAEEGLSSICMRRKGLSTA